MSDDVRFETWLTEVEHAIQEKLHITVSLGDLPDHPYRVWFDELMEPDEVAEQVLEVGL